MFKRRKSMNFNEDKEYICPVCGRTFFSQDSYPGCDFCSNHELTIYTNEMAKEINDEIDKMSPLESKEQEKSKRSAVYHELLYKKYVYNNPLFDKAKFDMRAEWEYEKAVEMEEGYRKRQEEKSRPRCPKCGCTEFQMVPRKWSPLTGFLTNKVDRVCVKCKTRY